MQSVPPNPDSRYVAFLPPTIPTENPFPSIECSVKLPDGMLHADDIDPGYNPLPALVPCCGPSAWVTEPTIGFTTFFPFYFPFLPVRRW